MNTPESHVRQIETLRRRIAGLEGGQRHGNPAPVRSGCAPLDRLLPGRGFRRGTIVQWLADGGGSGAETLALAMAAEASRDGGALVVLDRRREFYPPAAARLNVELQNLIVVYTNHRADHDWALDQALRCQGVAAVLAWPDRLDGRTYRRLQLAAEQGGGLGLLVRPAEARHEPSWADVCLLVEPRPLGESLESCRRRSRITLLHGRGTSNGRSVEVEIDDETRPVHPAAPLAETTACGHAAGV